MYTNYCVSDFVLLFKIKRAGWIYKFSHLSELYKTKSLNVYMIFTY